MSRGRYCCKAECNIDFPELGLATHWRDFHATENINTFLAPAKDESGNPVPDVLSFVRGNRRYYLCGFCKAKSRVYKAYDRAVAHFPKCEAPARAPRGAMNPGSNAASVAQGGDSEDESDLEVFLDGILSSLPAPASHAVAAPAPAPAVHPRVEANVAQRPPAPAPALAPVYAPSAAFGPSASALRRQPAAGIPPPARQPTLADVMEAINELREGLGNQLRWFRASMDDQLRVIRTRLNVIESAADAARVAADDALEAVQRHRRRFFDFYANDDAHDFDIVARAAPAPALEPRVDPLPLAAGDTCFICTALIDGAAVALGCCGKWLHEDCAAEWSRLAPNVNCAWCRRPRPPHRAHDAAEDGVANHNNYDHYMHVLELGGDGEGPAAPAPAPAAAAAAAAAPLPAPPSDDDDMAVGATGDVGTQVTASVSSRFVNVVDSLAVSPLSVPDSVPPAPAPAPAASAVVPASAAAAAPQPLPEVEGIPAHHSVSSSQSYPPPRGVLGMGQPNFSQRTADVEGQVPGASSAASLPSTIMPSGVASVDAGNILGISPTGAVVHRDEAWEEASFADEEEGEDGKGPGCVPPPAPAAAAGVPPPAPAAAAGGLPSGAIEVSRKRPLNTTLYPIKGDGNCFYHAIAWWEEYFRTGTAPSSTSSQYGRIARATQLRAAAVAKVQQLVRDGHPFHGHYYLSRADTFTDPSFNARVAAWADCQALDGVSAEEPEVYAMSLILGHPIHVCKLEGGNAFVLHYNSDAPNPPLLLRNAAYGRGREANHFDVLLRRDPRAAPAPAPAAVSPVPLSGRKRSRSGSRRRSRFGRPIFPPDNFTFTKSPEIEAEVYEPAQIQDNDDNEVEFEPALKRPRRK